MTGSRSLRAALAAATATWLAACAPPGPQTFEKAAAEATDSLVAQTGKLPPLLTRIESTVSTPDAGTRKGIVLDPMLDLVTGQQTETTALLERRVVQRIGNKYPQLEFLPFQPQTLARAAYLLTGTLSRPQAADDAPSRTLKIALALVDLKTSAVVAQAEALAQDENLDITPSRFYRDSPVLIKDKVVEGYAKTAATPVGGRADAYYLERITASSLISEATTFYNAERYQDALGSYQNALKTPQGQQLRAESGVYLSNARLGNAGEAEAAFGRIVALGIAYNELGVKFLFNPGSTEFWSDPKISGAYPMWLRQIAREALGAGSCMTVVGHTSRSGPAAANDALSLKRATFIRSKLASEQPSLAAKTKAEGMGFRQNIVGSGTDNGADVLDRRVEFRIVPC